MMIFFFKQKTAYEMRISDWSSDVCSSDLPYVLNEGVLHISGQLPFAPDGNIVTGILGADLGVERGAQAARYCAIMLMAQISEALDGDLDRVKRILKLGAFVASAPSFTDQPKEIGRAHV